MSATTSHTKSRRPYPEADLSKTYTSVPPVRVAQRHPFARWLTRLGAEFAWEALSPLEKRVVKVSFAVMVLLTTMLLYAMLRALLK